jgi:hypothetical protein
VALCYSNRKWTKARLSNFSDLIENKNTGYHQATGLKTRGPTTKKAHWSWQCRQSSRWQEAPEYTLSPTSPSNPGSRLTEWISLARWSDVAQGHTFHVCTVLPLDYNLCIHLFTLTGQVLPVCLLIPTVSVPFLMHLSALHYNWPQRLHPCHPRAHGPICPSLHLIDHKASSLQRTILPAILSCSVCKNTWWRFTLFGCCHN